MSKNKPKDFKIDLRTMKTNDARLVESVDKANKLMSKNSVHTSMRAMLVAYELQQWAFHELNKALGNDKIMADLMLHHVQQAANLPFHEENVYNELQDRVLDLMKRRITSNKIAERKAREKPDAKDDNSVRGDASDAAPQLPEEDRGAEDSGVVQEEGDDREVSGRGVDEDQPGSDGAPAGQPG